MDDERNFVGTSWTTNGKNGCGSHKWSGRRTSGVVRLCDLRRWNRLNTENTEALRDLRVKL